MEVDEPLIDEMFGLRIQNAVRIQRTVEVIRYELRSREKFMREMPFDDIGQSSWEDQEVVGRDVAINANYELRWREVTRDL